MVEDSCAKKQPPIPSAAMFASFLWSVFEVYHAPRKDLALLFSSFGRQNSI